MIAVACACGHSGSVPEKFAGQQVRCPKCRDKIDVPGAVQAATPSPEPASPFSELDAAPPRESLVQNIRRPAHRRFPASGPGIASAAIGMLSLLVVAIGVVILLSKTAEYHIKNNTEGMTIHDTAEARRGAMTGAKIVAAGACLSTVLAPIGLVLGICALFQSDRNHLPSRWGILLNGLALLGVVLLFLW